MKLTRIAFIAALAVAVNAPVASASVPVDRGTHSAAQTFNDSGQSSGYAGMAAHREAIATRNWEQIAEAPTVSLAPAPGSDTAAVPTGVVIAGLLAVLLTLVLLGRSAIGRRRTRVGAVA